MTPVQNPDIEGAVGMKVPLSRPWVGDEEARAAADVVRSGWLIQGPRVAEFEDRFATLHGAEHAVACNSGSSALLIAMAALGVERGDEVVCPDMSFVTTASAALFLGARPVFTDLEMTWYGMDPGDLERWIGPRTRAIVPVHYAGHTADMEGILDVAERHGVPVLEDAAEAHRARYRGDRFAGTLGRIGIFSFTPSKVMTTGEGGMVVTDDPGLAERCRRFRNMGDTGKFEWAELGFNLRMPEAMGAVGLAQLDRLDEAIRRRRALAERYTRALEGREEVLTPAVRTPDDTSRQLYTIRLVGAPGLRDRVKASLAGRGVSSRLYYPAFHHQGVFRATGPYDPADYPNARAFEATALSLPLFPTMTEAEQDYVIDALRQALGEG